MILAHSVEQPAAGSPGLFVTLSYEQRFLRRKRLITDCGMAFTVELPETLSLAEGDAFVLEDGRRVQVLAAVERLAAVRHKELTRIAWHIGNRHTPCQIKDDCLIIQKDPVLEDLMRKLGASLHDLKAPFYPEGGAYGHGRTHAHTH